MNNTQIPLNFATLAGLLKQQRFREKYTFLPALKNFQAVEAKRRFYSIKYSVIADTDEIYPLSDLLHNSLLFCRELSDDSYFSHF